MGARLIVTGDDFGRSSAVNEAVMRAHDEGILTSASLMVTAPRAGEAVALAREAPSLAVGLHLVLTDGSAAAPPASVPHLVGADGRFPSDPTVAGLRYYFDRRTHRELGREISAQLERFRTTGLPLSHVDGHHHLHLHPSVLPILSPLARRYGARGIRVVTDDLSLALRFPGPRLSTKLGWHLAFSLLARYAAARTDGLATVDRVYGLLQTGHVSEAYVCHLLQDARFTTAELYTHPGAHQTTEIGPGHSIDPGYSIDPGPSPPIDPGPRRRPLGPPPADDLWALVSHQTRAVLERRRIGLISYADLADTSTGIDSDTGAIQPPGAPKRPPAAP